MKRLHVNLSVADLDESIKYYTSLFGAAPSVQKADYAKWLVDDPRVNFSITSRGGRPGLDHFGFEAETEEELQDIYARYDAANDDRREDGETVCCYARSVKSWSHDPDGLAWEAFRTLGASETFDGKSAPEQKASAQAPTKKACC